MLPRPIADWLALWRDLPRHPRQVLLNRSHFPTSSLIVAVSLLLDGIVGAPITAWIVYAALAICGPSSLVAVTGLAAHALWSCGRLWTDLDCEACGDGPDDGDDEGEPEPDDPADDSGLAVDRYRDQHVLAA
ncbi:hypothetical protein ACGF5F_32550 [Streptomyces sp. NPDC047821]|uniref:hypothetical protein n=1 Tax=Streptomyces sp. NPDC047821 TaxID=3365488 RepID=UPI0037195BC7